MRKVRFYSFIAAIACVVAAGLMLTACDNNSGKSKDAGGEPSDGKIRLQLWHYFTAAQEESLRNLCKKFEEQNPNVSVTPIYQGNPMQLSQKLSGSLAATPANNPVVSTVYENWTSDYVEKGYLKPVSDFFETTNGLTKEEQADFIEVYRTANTFDGKWYTMPFNKSIYLLFYNTEMFEAAGYKEAPKTLEDFVDCIKKCTIREGTRTKVYGFGAMVGGEVFTTFYFASGGKFLTPDNKVAFNTPVAEKILQTIRDLQYPHKYIYADSSYMTTPLTNKQIACYIYSSAGLPFLNKQIAGRFRWSVAPVPGLAGTEGKQLMQGTNLGIFNNKSPEETDAAWDLVKFLTTRESAVYWATNTGYMPIRYSMLEDPEMKTYMEQNPPYKIGAEQVLANKGMIEPTIAVWEGIRINITDMVDMILNKNMSPADVLKTTVDKTTAKLEEFAAKKAAKQ